jgi:tellurite resistance-related uncharacterized protein
MQRRMTGFRQDAESHWVAELDCGHTQHVRHEPPFTLRPWVLTEEGRAGRLGQTLECVLCERREIPSGYAPYKRTPTFRRETVPPGLLRRHDTKAGIWAVVHVVAGDVEYFEPTDSGETRVVLRAGETVTVAPEREHRVAMGEGSSFFIELWRRDAEST